MSETSDTLETLRARLDQQAEMEKLLLEITQRIASSSQLDDMLPFIAGAVQRALKADGAAILQANQVISAGELGAALAELGQSLLELAAQQSALDTAEVAAHPSIEPNLDGIQSLMTLPLVAQGIRHGALVIGYRAQHTLTEQERVFLALAAGQTAVAIENDAAFEAMRQSQQSLAAILTSTADPVIVIDATEKIVLLNPAAERALAVRTQSVIGKRVSDLISAEPLLEMLRGEGGETLEWQNDSGQTFAPHVSEINPDDPDHRGRVLILQDITRYKTLHANQNEFVSTVSHDLRSPLTYMQGYATMLPMVGELNPKQKDHVDKIISGIAQMTDLIDKILDAGRLDPETGYYELSREACDVTKMVNDLVSVHSQPAEKKGLKLTAEIDPDLPILNLDDVMLRRALNNLIDNAIKYTPDGGSVTVGAHVKNGNLLLSVADTGLGISEENQKRLFERFQRVRRREHQRIKGIGLGLFIVKSVAQRHGGEAWVESAEGKGSAFNIRIPLEGVNLLGAEAKKPDMA